MRCFDNLQIVDVKTEKEEIEMDAVRSIYFNLYIRAVPSEKFYCKWYIFGI